MSTGPVHSSLSHYRAVLTGVAVLDEAIELGDLLHEAALHVPPHHLQHLLTHLPLHTTVQLFQPSLHLRQEEWVPGALYLEYGRVLPEVCFI